MQSWNTLDSTGILSMIISKFLQHIRDRWNRKMLRKRHQKPRLSDLFYFIEEELALVNDSFGFKNATMSIKRNQWNLLEGTWRWNWQEQGKMKIKRRNARCVRLRSGKSSWRIVFCCYDFMNKEIRGENFPKIRKCSICKEQHHTGLHVFYIRKIFIRKWA